MTASLKISDVARDVGVTTDAVRYYESVGLLRPPDRTVAGYRMYDDSAVERLRFIRGAQRVGPSLREISELLEVMDRGQCPCGHTDVLLRRRIAELDQELAQLRALRAELVDWSTSTPKAPARTRRASGGVEPSSQTGGDENGTVPQLWLPVRRAAVPVLRRGMNRGRD